MRNIPAIVSEKAGFVVPVRMTERAYDYIMDKANYLLIDQDVTDMNLVLLTAVTQIAMNRNMGDKFVVPFEWGPKDFTYTVADDGKDVAVEIDLCRL